MGTVFRREVSGFLVGVGFHSINVPSEWEQDPSLWDDSLPDEVSIQLMSPASGNSLKGCLASRKRELFIAGFHSINVPSEWEHYRSIFSKIIYEGKVFPFN